MENIDLTINGIALLPIIVAVVELAKRLGLKTDYAPWLTGVLSVLGYVLVQGVKVYPEYTNYVVMVLTAVLVFLSSTGLYTVGKNVIQSFRRG